MMLLTMHVQLTTHKASIIPPRNVQLLIRLVSEVVLFRALSSGTDRTGPDDRSKLKLPGIKAYCAVVDAKG
jgi:hypothetical protein